MTKNIKANKKHNLESISNKLYAVKKQQKSLRQTEKDLKADLLNKMTSNSHQDTNGTIEKIKRKPKRIFDADKLRTALLKRKILEVDIEEIIGESTRRLVTPVHIAGCIYA